MPRPLNRAARLISRGRCTSCCGWLATRAYAKHVCTRCVKRRLEARRRSHSLPGNPGKRTRSGARRRGRCESRCGGRGFGTECLACSGTERRKSITATEEIDHDESHWTAAEQAAALDDAVVSGRRG